MLRLIVLIIAVTLFWGCSKETIYRKIIQNDSSKNIEFYFYGANNPQVFGDTVIVNAGETKTIYEEFEENSSVANPQPCNILEDSIRIVISGGGTLNKSLFDANDWDYTTEEKIQACTFSITDADIQ